MSKIVRIANKKDWEDLLEVANKYEALSKGEKIALQSDNRLIMMGGGFEFLSGKIIEDDYGFLEASKRLRLGWTKADKSDLDITYYFSEFKTYKLGDVIDNIDVIKLKNELLDYCKKQKIITKPSVRKNNPKARFDDYPNVIKLNDNQIFRSTIS